METFEINSSNDIEPLKVNYFKGRNSKELVIIVEGWLGTKDTIAPVAKRIIAIGLKCSFATFTFRGYEYENFRSLNQQITDLKEIVRYFSEKVVEKVKIVCISAGAFSVCNLLASNDYDSLITNVIFLDPADYYIKKSANKGEPETWTGVQQFEPNDKVAADLLPNIKSEVKVDVVNFTLRNYTKNGYATDRGIDNPNGFERLNHQMKKNFYDKTPVKNQGKYIEVNGIPHAIMRDGNVSENVKKVGELLHDLLTN